MTRHARPIAGKVVVIGGSDERAVPGGIAAVQLKGIGGVDIKDAEPLPHAQPECVPLRETRRFELPHIALRRIGSWNTAVRPRRSPRQGSIQVASAKQMAGAAALEGSRDKEIPREAALDGERDVHAVWRSEFVIPNAS